MAVAPDWIESYLDWTATQESPEIFHRWSAIVTIAAVLNRKVRLVRRDPRGREYFTTFPGQISPILVAGSGKGRKSTTVALAKDLMKEAKVEIYDGKITPERLLAKLDGFVRAGKQAVLCTVASEFSALVGTQSYNNGFVDILIKLADCDSHPYETQTHTYDLSGANLCFTLFGATTPTALSEAIPTQAQSHGFTSRYIWVYSDEGRSPDALANDLSTIDPNDVQMSNKQHDSLLARLIDMRRLSGEFKWGKAKDWYEHEYNEHRRNAIDDGGWAYRKFDHLARVAMVLNVSRGCTDLTFIEADLVNAKTLVDQVEVNLPKCFELIGRHYNAVHQDKIIAVLKPLSIQPAGITHPDLVLKVRRHFMNLDEIERQLKILEYTGIAGRVAKNGIDHWYLLKR